MFTIVAKSGDRRLGELRVDKISKNVVLGQMPLENGEFINAFSVDGTTVKIVAHEAGDNDGEITFSGELPAEFYFGGRNVKVQVYP